VFNHSFVNCLVMGFTLPKGFFFQFYHL
jgi:hypothetical protein